ncbi:hypothetical protein STENM223S_07976 [Streptomyces tendae]
MPESTVRTLLAGGAPPADTVNDRVRARIRALAHTHMSRSGGRMADLAADIHARLGVSEYWARQVCDGRKVPSVELLHGLVEFFGVEGGEAFFTASAPDALNRALLPLLERLDPLDRSPDGAHRPLRREGDGLPPDGAMTPAQLDRLGPGRAPAVRARRLPGRAAAAGGDAADRGRGADAVPADRPGER